MNQKISVLYDREHTIGHAYFMPLKNNPTVETLASIFKSAILPLLQEYFYEDYEKIRLVLGDNKKVNESEQFIIKNVIDYDALFGSTDFDFGYTRYKCIASTEINAAAFSIIKAYHSI